MKISDPKVKKTILQAQKNELTEHFIYLRLAEKTKGKNKQVLKQIGQDELNHYNFWKKYTKQELQPNKFKIYFYLLTARLFGLTFAIKLMEQGEEEAQVVYQKISHLFPGAKKIVKEEDEHEKKLISLINEEKLKYIGSIVLGLNDALVELTGALAGLTLALANNRLIAMTGLITGIAASFSMAASEYLSITSQEEKLNPFKAAVYTGITYILTVFLLILPFLIINKPVISLTLTLTQAVFIIFIFNFYISVAKDAPFKKRFLEMATISLGVAGLSFAIGFLIRYNFKIEV